MELVKYCILGCLGGFLLNVTRIVQNWIIARVYNNMALSWNYLQIRARVQIEIFSVYIIVGILCGIMFYIIKKLYRRKGKYEK